MSIDRKDRHRGPEALLNTQPGCQASPRRFIGHPRLGLAVQLGPKRPALSILASSPGRWTVAAATQHFVNSSGGTSSMITGLAGHVAPVQMFPPLTVV